MHNKNAVFNTLGGENYGSFSDKGATGYGAAAKEGGDWHTFLAGSLDFQKAESSVGS